MQLNPSTIRLNQFSLAVADHVSAMLAYWDKDLVCRFANVTYQEWFGYTREEMVDKMTIKELLGPVYELNLPYIQAALAGENQTFEREITLPDGSTRFCLVNYFPDINEGMVLGFHTHVADITPIKGLENQLKESYQVIAEQNNRLLNFANTVTHNLKTYAFNFKGIVDLIGQAKNEEEKVMFWNHLCSLCDNFTDTIAHLTAAIETRNITGLELRALSVTEHITRCLQILQLQINSSKAYIRYRPKADLRVMAHPAYLESILLNLASNALKYRKPDVLPVIEIHARQEAEHVVITISDNGIGIDMEKHQADLFGLFKTFHDNADAKGLGLYIVKSQVEAMGGSIQVESAVETGTTFLIRLKAEPHP